MLRVLLIFTTITVAYCNEYCPRPDFTWYDSFGNNAAALQSGYNGNFKVVYTSAVSGDCVRAKYSVEAPTCCIHLEDFDFNVNELNYTLGSHSPDCVGLSTHEYGLVKLLYTSGSGNNLCLMIALCRPTNYGISVLCRGEAPPLYHFKAILLNLLAIVLLDPTLALREVQHTNCQYPSDHCPVIN